jgi:hypothetical protein
METVHEKIDVIRLRTLCSNESINPTGIKRSGVDELSKRSGFSPEFFTRSSFFLKTVIFYQGKENIVNLFKPEKFPEEIVRIRE